MSDTERSDALARYRRMSHSGSVILAGWEVAELLTAYDALRARLVATEAVCAEWERDGLLGGVYLTDELQDALDVLCATTPTPDGGA